MKGDQVFPSGPNSSEVAGIIDMLIDSFWRANRPEIRNRPAIIADARRIATNCGEVIDKWCAGLAKFEARNVLISNIKWKNS